MKTIRISQANLNGEPLKPEAELFVLRAEIERIEKLEPGENVPIGRDSVCSKEVLLGAYRRRYETVRSGMIPEGAKEAELAVSLEVEDKAKEAYSVGIVQLGEDGEPIASREDLSAAALADSIEKAEVGSPALKRLREIIEEAKLTPAEAEQFMTKIAQLAAMKRYADMPREEYHKAADQARVERLAQRGFVTPVQTGVGEVAKVHVPEEKPKLSKLERKLQRRQK